MMNIHVCNRAALGAAVKRVARVACRDGGGLPVECLRMRLLIGRGLLEIAATDLDVTAAAALPVECVSGAGDEAWLVPARRMADVLAADWGEDVRIEVAGDATTLQLDGGSVRMTAPPAEDHPDLPLPEPDAVEPDRRVDGAALAASLAHARLALGRTGSPVLDALLIAEHGDDGVLIAANDRNQLVLRCDLNSGEVGRQFLVTRAFSDLLRDMATRAGGDVSLAMGERYVRAWAGDEAVVGRCVVGQYPDVMRLVRDTGALQRCEVQRARYLDALRVVAAAAGHNDATVRLRSGGGALVVSSDDAAATITVDADCRGTFGVRAGARYLRDLASVTDDGVVALYTAGGEEPIITRGGDWYHLVMPRCEA